MLDTEKVIPSLKSLASQRITQLYFDEISGREIFERTYNSFIPSQILSELSDIIKGDFNNILSVRGGNSLYFVLNPEEEDFAKKPCDSQTLILENRYGKKLWFQIFPLYIPDLSFNCKTIFFPVFTIEPNQCLCYDVFISTIAPLTRRRRTITKPFKVCGELLIFVWDGNPKSEATTKKRGIIKTNCYFSLGRYLPLNFELLMSVTNGRHQKLNSIRRKYFEEKDHVHRYLFN